MRATPRVSLFRDLGPDAPYFVDLDALFVEALQQDPAYEHSTLGLCWKVERMLYDLSACSPDVTLVACHALGVNLWSARPLVAAARAATLRNLKLVSGESLKVLEVVDGYPWASEVLARDVRVSRPALWFVPMQHGDDLNAALISYAYAVGDMFEVPPALLAGARWELNDVIGHTVQLRASVGPYPDVPAPEAVADPSLPWLHSWCTDGDGTPTAVTEALFDACVALAMKDGGTPPWVAKALLLTHCVQCEADLETRALQRFNHLEVCPKVVRDFVLRVASNVPCVLRATDLHAPAAADVPVVDLFDLRLLAGIMWSLANPDAPPSPDTCQVVQRRWSRILHASAGVAVAPDEDSHQFWPVCLSDAEVGRMQIYATAGVDALDHFCIGPLKCAELGEAMGPDVARLPTHDVLQDFGRSLAPPDDYHWHTGKGLREALGAQSAKAWTRQRPGDSDPVPAWVVKLRKKYKQQAAARDQRQGQSIVGDGIWRKKTISKQRPAAPQRESRKAAAIREANQRDTTLSKLTTLLEDVQRDFTAKSGVFNEEMAQKCSDRLVHVLRCATRDDKDKRHIRRDCLRHIRELSNYIARFPKNPRAQHVGLCLSHAVAEATDVNESPRLRKKLADMLQRLGFGAAARALWTKADQPLVPKCHVTLQLDRFGDKLLPPAGVSGDDRVSFEPDEWQVELMDAVDTGTSVLCVAPTSSGKTFISYYAVERVLRASDDDVLVWVCPSKALVNQVHQDVVSRFEKTYSNPSRCLVGLFTRDRRDHAETCQILITVPQCLSILLLSQGVEWTNRLSYVVFDEVHCLNLVETGSVWELLLSIVPCPLLALSATVGNPTMFQDWLREVRSGMPGEPCKLVHHPHRHADLRTAVVLAEAASFDPETHMTPQNGLHAHDPRLDTFLSCSWQDVHPAYWADPDQIRVQGWPSAMAFEPRDTLKLWKRMKTALAEVPDVPGEVAEALQACAPRSWLGEGSAHRSRQCRITLREAREWTAAVKVVVRMALCDERTRAATEAVFGQLGQCKPALQVEPMEDAGRALFTTLLDLLRRPSEAGLPAIVFGWDRSALEALAGQLYRECRAAQKRWEETPKFQALWEKYEADKAAYEQRPIFVDVNDRMAMLGNVPEDTPPVDPRLGPMGWGFRMRSSAQYQEDLRRVVNDCLSSNWFEDPVLLKCLAYGIGVHHAGLPVAYRRGVEQLFRLGVLGVVLSTSTLAMGIHMPCRTVIFVGDAPYFNATTYRQMRGRAGRRGFDTLGRSLFLNVPLPKVRRLVQSASPSLRGHWVLSPATIVRLLSMADGQESRDMAFSHLRLLMEAPSMTGRRNVTVRTCTALTQHFVRFSIDMSQRLGLLNAEAQPLDLAHLICHCHWTEPDCFVALAVLASPELAKCGDEESLLEVMCHLFLREPVQRNFYRKWPRHVLAPLEAPIQRKVDAYNRMVLDSWSNYLRTVCATLPASGVPRCLPMSRAKACGDGATSLVTPFVPKCLRQFPKYLRVRSLFHCIATGRNDMQWNGEHDLAHHVRLDVPVLGLPLPTREPMPYVNSYIRDFFRHGDLVRLHNENGVKHAWQTMKSFSLLLRAVAIALQTGGSRVAFRLSRLAEAFECKFRRTLH